MTAGRSGRSILINTGSFVSGASILINTGGGATGSNLLINTGSGEAGSNILINTGGGQRPPNILINTGGGGQGKTTLNNEGDPSIHAQLGDLTAAERERVREEGDVYIQVDEGRIVYVHGTDVVIDEYTPKGRENVTSIADYPESEVEHKIKTGQWRPLND